MIRRLMPHVRRNVLKWLAWRSFGFTLVANQVVTPLIGMAVWSAALPDRTDLITYYAALLFVRLVTVSYENHTFSGRIYDGQLADELLRPQPVILDPLGENLALRLFHVSVGAPLLAAVMLMAGVQMEWASVAMALPALLLAAALRFLFTYLLALSAFWTERAHGVVAIGNTMIFLLGGEAAPPGLLPEALRTWAEMLPFRAMHAFPAEVAAGSVTGRAVVYGYIWQVIWLAALTGVHTWVWRRGIRRYTAIGG